MNRFSSTWILISSILLSLQLANDFVQITVEDRFLEGYGYGIYLFLFDLSVVIPLLLLLVRKNKPLIVWALLTIIPLNATVGLGWKWGSLIGVLITVTSLVVYFTKVNVASKDKMTRS